MKRRRAGARLLLIMALGASLVLAQQRGWLSPLTDVFQLVSRPVGGALSGAGRGLGGLFGASSLRQQNQSLRQEAADLRQELTKLKEAEAQNKLLRQQLGLEGQSDHRLLPAAVVAYQPDNYRQFLTLSRGSSDGLKVGQAVMAEGYLVGKISELTSHSAKVFLIINPDFRVNGLTQESRTSGTVRGQLGSGLLMDKIPQGEIVKPGDSVITSGLGGEFPKGLLIGQVESVNQSDNAIFQTAQIATGVKFTKLELVFVVDD